MSLIVASTAMSAFGAIQKGNAANANAKAQQAQLISNAKAERAASQRAAIEERRQAKIAQSRAVAVGAAQGGALDKSGIDIFQALGEEGMYRSDVMLAEGENRARGMEYQGQILRAEGKQAKRQGQMSAVGELLKGGAGFMSQYGDKLFGPGDGAPTGTPSGLGMRGNSPPWGPS